MSFHQKRLSSCKTASSERGKLLVVGLNRLSRGAAGNEDFDNRVAAETVAAVHAAGDFTRSEEARNNLAVDVDDFSLGVDLDAAHGVMHGGRAVARVRDALQAEGGQRAGRVVADADLHAAVEAVGRDFRALDHQRLRLV